MIRLAPETPRGSNRSPCPNASRPRIDVGERDLTRWRDLAWEGIARANDPPWLFARAGRVVELAGGEPREVGADRLRSILADAVHFGRIKARDWRSELPPEALARELLGDPNPALPPLFALYPYPVTVPRNAAAVHPVERGEHSPLGRLLLAPGYDRETGIYRRADPQLDGLKIPSDPSAAHVKAARQLLVDELLGSVDLARDSDRAAALAFLLTFFLRPMFPGTAPGFLFQAPVQGSGKTRLLISLASIALGRPPALSKVPSTDDELEKRFVGWLRAGSPLIALDNVSGHFTSETVAAYLTSPVFQGRLLGSNANPAFSPTAILALTVNNASLDADLIRRFLPINLDPRVERPADRPLASFRHVLPEWAVEHRVELVSACLTVIVAALRDGVVSHPTDGVVGNSTADRPYTGPVLASFEEWSRLVGKTLDLLELPGFLVDRGDFESEADPDAVPWRLFVAACGERFRDQPFSTADVYPLVDGIADFPLPSGPDDKRKISLGKRIRNRRGQVFGAWRIVALGASRKNAAVWRLEQALDSAASTAVADPPASNAPLLAALGIPDEPTEPCHCCQRSRWGYDGTRWSCGACNGRDANQAVSSSVGPMSPTAGIEPVPASCPGCGGRVEPRGVDPSSLGYPPGSRVWHCVNRCCGRIVYCPAGGAS